MSEYGVAIPSADDDDDDDVDVDGVAVVLAAVTSVALHACTTKSASLSNTTSRHSYSSRNSRRGGGGICEVK
jgi:hypothetical protein